MGVFVAFCGFIFCTILAGIGIKINQWALDKELKNMEDEELNMEDEELNTKHYSYDSLEYIRMASIIFVILTGLMAALSLGFISVKYIEFLISLM